MRHRFAFVRLVTVLALGAMVSFMAMGCGDDDNQVQNDAGQQQDANIQQEDAPAQVDVAATDTPVQTDTLVQTDVAIPSGTIVITQVLPQQVSAAIPDIRLPFMSASWSDKAVADLPVAEVFEAGAMAGLGCEAKRYKFSDGKFPVSSTHNAGTVTVSDFTPGKVFTNFPGPLPDGGPAALPDFPSEITCTRTEKYIGDAGTGTFEYNCGTNPAPYFSAPSTGFLTGGDKINVATTGGTVPAFTLSGTTGATVAPLIQPELNMFGFPANYTDAGTLPVPYNCGAETVADAGVKACGPATVIVIFLTSSDTPAPYFPLMDETPTNEFGYIQCSVLAAGATGRSFTISKQMLDTAFPSTLKWTTLRFVTLHLSLNISGTTLVGVGQGQLGMVANPAVPDGGWY